MKEVCLRAMEPEDLDLLYKIENDERLWNVSTTNVPYSRYVLRDYIANAKNDIFADNQVRLIIETDTKTNIGILDLVNFDPRHQRAELGIIILEEFRGKGYAYAAIQKIIEHARKYLHLRQIYAYIDANNEASLKCLETVGFQKKACLKDWFFETNDFHDAYVMQFFL
ncbi:Spermidine N(1)-acetyltransferase [Prevotella intermedia]|nr:Spermidine N(1)-acetyltransferase [Prevotella intermedia]